MIFLSLPILACVLSYFICKSSFYQQYADPRWVRAANEIYVAHDVDCQVLVYGDSSAITGIDPAIVARITGMKTCNAAQTKGSLVVLGTHALDRFLEHNARPRVLILQFSGADFYRAESWFDTTAYMEGGIALLRYYRPKEVAAVVLRHPSLLLGMMHYAYITDPLNWFLHRRETHTPATSERTPINVHLTLKQPAFRSCKQEMDADPMFHAPDARFISALREHYGRLADRVIIDVAPTSTCDGHAPFLRRSLSGLDNSLEQYPVAMFNEGYTHFTADGARELSTEIGQQIAGNRHQVPAMATGR